MSKTGNLHPKIKMSQFAIDLAKDIATKGGKAIYLNVESEPDDRDIANKYTAIKIMGWTMTKDSSIPDLVLYSGKTEKRNGLKVINIHSGWDPMIKPEQALSVAQKVVGRTGSFGLVYHNGKWYATIFIYDKSGQKIGSSNVEGNSRAEVISLAAIQAFRDRQATLDAKRSKKKGNSNE